MQRINTLKRSIRTTTQIRLFATTDNTGPSPQNPQKLTQHNQVPQSQYYKADPRVNIIIKESPSHTRNQVEKAAYNKLIKAAAIGLNKNYKKDSQHVKDNTEAFIVKLAENFDGRTFAIFIKHLNELKKDVIDRNKNMGHSVSPDSFLSFLEKMRELTHSPRLNEMILEKLAGVNVDMLKVKTLLNTYQSHSADFKFEESIRMGEIKKFAEDVIPKSRFIFDRYSVDSKNEKDAPEQEEDYFSFFGSHEQAILKPESSFRNLHELMTNLPVDYYILFQAGEENEQESIEDQKTRSDTSNKDTLYGSNLPRSNLIMFSGLPVLHKKTTMFKKNSRAYKTLAFEDIQRCLDRSEAVDMLSDPYAAGEMTRLLTQYYGGKVGKVQYINFDPDALAAPFFHTWGGLHHDHVDEFQQFIDYNATSGNSGRPQSTEYGATDDVSEYIRSQMEFDEIMQVSGDKFFSEKAEREYQDKLEREELLSQTKLDEQRAAEYVRARERLIRGLDREVGRSGFLSFDSYVSKLKMMDHPLFLFGMKLHGMQGAVEFFDADFCNTLVIKSDLFDGVTLGRVGELLNEILLQKGFDQGTLQVGKLKDISDGFDLSNIIVRSDYKICLRFRDFQQATRAYKAFTAVNLATRDSTQKEEDKTDVERQHLERVRKLKKDAATGDDLYVPDALKVTFQNPEPNYYDGKFATHFESCIKNKFEGLEEINEVPSDYVVQSLKDHNIKSRRIPPGM